MNCYRENCFCRENDDSNVYGCSCVSSCPNIVRVKSNFSYSTSSEKPMNIEENLDYFDGIRLYKNVNR